MNDDAIRNIILSTSIYSSNSNALISIYKDSEEMRLRKMSEVDKEINDLVSSGFENAIKEVEENNPLFDDYNHYQHHFDYLLLNSLFLSCFSLFENHLKRLSSLSEQHINSKIKFSDINGKGDIDRMRKYLFLVHNISKATSDNKEWNEILEFKAIRNAIVHTGSVLNPDRKSKPEKLMGYKKLLQHKIWTSSEAVYFRLKKISFLEDFRNITKQFTNSISAEIISKLKDG